MIVLNDDSEDKTLEILKEIQERDSRLTIIDNKTVRSDWLRKTNACQILFENSKGEILVFIDADTFHNENAILKAVSFLIKKDLDFLSVFPQEIVVSFFEKIIIPFINFSLMSFRPFIPFANGQFTVYKRYVLEKLCGFEKIKDEVLMV